MFKLLEEAPNKTSGSSRERLKFCLEGKFWRSNSVLGRSFTVINFLGPLTEAKQYLSISVLFNIAKLNSSFFTGLSGHTPGISGRKSLELLCFCWYNSLPVANHNYEYIKSLKPNSRSSCWALPSAVFRTLIILILFYSDSACQTSLSVSEAFQSAAQALPFLPGWVCACTVQPSCKGCSAKFRSFSKITPWTLSKATDYFLIGYTCFVAFFMFPGTFQFWTSCILEMFYENLNVGGFPKRLWQTLLSLI